MEWWDRANNTLMRVWIGLAGRLGLRNSGLLKLRKDIRMCEYDDIHVMWEMLQRSDADPSSPRKQGRMRRFLLWRMFVCSPYLARRF
ncbi:hypothetical protein Scep_001137 [Stephania cephalantha]|uniref:Uncharacterized protein n=1 Tax=Stephania cephalantha TaxID=152367 RepID=A0AAP0L7U8_9MAGN